MASSEPARPAGVDYAAALAEAKALVQSARTRAALAANNELIGLYWRIGHLILNRQVADGWGTKVVERLSRDLRAEFAGMRAASWPTLGKVPRHSRRSVRSLNPPLTRLSHNGEVWVMGRCQRACFGCASHCATGRLFAPRGCQPHHRRRPAHRRDDCSLPRGHHPDGVSMLR